MACLADLDFEVIRSILGDHPDRQDIVTSFVAASRGGYVELFDRLYSFFYKDDSSEDESYDDDSSEDDSDEGDSSEDESYDDDSSEDDSDEGVILAYCLGWAAQSGQNAMIDHLSEEYGMEVKRYVGPLHQAAQSGQTRTVQHLIEVYGVDPCQKYGGQTAREFSVESGERAVAQLLLEYEREARSRESKKNRPVRRRPRPPAL